MTIAHRIRQTSGLILSMGEFMTERLSGDELVALVKRVFQPRENETGLAILVDLPDATIPDNKDWATRREIAAGWLDELAVRQSELGL